MAKRLFYATVSVDLIIVIHDDEELAAMNEIAVRNAERAMQDTPHDCYNVEEIFEIGSVSEIPPDFIGSLPYNSNSNRSVEDYFND